MYIIYQTRELKEMIKFYALQHFGLTMKVNMDKQISKTGGIL